MVNNNRKRISDHTMSLITNYYKDLYKKNEFKTSTEICNDLAISRFTLSRYWEYIGLNDISVKGYGNTLAKIVLLHTNFSYLSPYYNESKTFKEEAKKLKQEEKSKRNYEILIRLKEDVELKKARQNLVNTLKNISVNKKEWVEMTYNEIMNIQDIPTRIEYIKKYRIGLVYFVNPLYDSLNKKQKEEYDEFDPSKNPIPMIQKINKLKELVGGTEKAKEIVNRRFK